MHSSGPRRAPAPPPARPSSTPRVPREPRQPRGLRRVTGILDAAEVLIAETGVDAISTTAIAARAGASVGSLYYFFPGKEAIVEALAQRFATLSGAVMDAASSDIAHGPLGRVVLDLASLIQQRPAFSAVFDACSRHECASAGPLPLHEVCVGQMCDLLEARLPGMPSHERRIVAALVVSMMVGAFKELHGIPHRQRAGMIRELHAMLTRYAAPLDARYGMPNALGVSRTSTTPRQTG